MKSILTLALLTILLSFNVTSNNSPLRANIEAKPSVEEQKLYDAIMEYRKSKNLKAIPMNADLNIVAQSHVNDLNDNQPVGGKCNLHSWSNKGNWTGCCYTDDHKSAECLWNKPSEITDYSGMGYEIAFWSSSPTNARESLEAWKKSRGHNELLVNKGIWKKEWKAIGVGIRDNYAVVWFGREEN